MTATVAVVGGGYGGVAAAKALDDIADVVLIEPKDAFVHHVGALRGLVDPDWVDRLFLPYDRLLARGRVVRDRATLVEDGAVTLASGGQVAADYVVLATGVEYPFPAKMGTDDGPAARAGLRAARADLERADRVLLLGAGPVGLELAGELVAVWPDRQVTVVDPASDILAGAYPEPFRAELRAQLDKLGVELVLGDRLSTDPPTVPGAVAPFTVRTEGGRTLAADVWFRCYGGAPDTAYLGGGLAGAREPGGRIAVGPDLRVRGQRRVFAIGDVTALPEPKLARAAGRHAAVVAANIRADLGRGEPATYETDPPAIVLPLGPTGGATYTPELGVLGADRTAKIKGEGLRLDAQREALGLT